MITTNQNHKKGKVSKSFGASAKKMFYGTLIIAVGVASFATVKANQISVSDLAPEKLVEVTAVSNISNDTNEVLDYLEYTNQVEDDYVNRVGVAVSNLKNGTSTNVNEDYTEVVNFCLMTAKSQIIADKHLNIDDIDALRILPNYSSSNEVPSYGVEFTDKVTNEKIFFNYDSSDSSPVYDMLGTLYTMQNCNPEQDSKKVSELYYKFAKSLVTFQNYKDSFETVNKNVK